MKLRTLQQEPPEPFPINPNPHALKVGDRVVTDFYPDKVHLIRTVKEVIPGPMFRSGQGLRVTGPDQQVVIGLSILIDAGRCLPVGPDGKIVS